jgi:hypothetical protein
MIDDLIGKDLNMFTLIVLYICYYIIATVLPSIKLSGKYTCSRTFIVWSAIVAFGMFMYGNPIPELTLTNIKDLPLQSRNNHLLRFSGSYNPITNNR